MNKTLLALALLLFPSAALAQEVPATQPTMNVHIQNNTNTILEGIRRAILLTTGTSSGSGLFITSGSGTVDSFHLANTTVTAGTYGSGTAIPQISIDADGRIVSASNITIQTLSTSSAVSELIITTGTDANMMTVSADYIDVMGAFIQNLSTTVALNKNGAGGLDTGSEGASREYYVYAISNNAGTQYGAIATSSGNLIPTLPTWATKWRRIGSIFNDGSSNLRATRQRGRSVTYIHPPVLVSVADASDVATQVFMSNYVASGTVTYSLSIKPVGASTEDAIWLYHFPVEQVNEGGQNLGRRWFMSAATAGSNRIHGSYRWDMYVIKNRDFIYQDESKIDNLDIHLLGYVDTVP